jgi:hypothetical protein
MFPYVDFMPLWWAHGDIKEYLNCLVLANIPTLALIMFRNS